MAVGLFLAPAIGCSSSNQNPNGAGGAGATTGGGGAPVDAGTDSPTGAGGAPADAGTDAPNTPGTTPVMLVFGPPVLAMNEGQATPGMLSLGLDREWSADITVTVTSANPNVATVLQTSVTFPAFSMTPQAIQVLAPTDDDTVDNSTTIVASSVETGSKSITVNVKDPDIESLLPYPTIVAMTEGQTSALTMRLSKKPASAVVVTLASSNTAKLTLDTPTMTFDASNYSIPQTATLTAVKDDDANNEHVAVNVSATGNVGAISVPVNITDIDAVNLDVTPSSVALEERANMPGTVMVSLTKAPPSAMNVQVMSSNTAKVTATPALLAFTPDNYNVPQPVTIAAVPDTDANNENEKVTFTATGITPVPDSRDVMVTVHDSDSQSITAIPASVTFLEGTSTTFTVQLAIQPNADTAVSVYSQNPGIIQVLPPVLHFNADNYNMPQTVTLQAQQDDDLADNDCNITLIASAASTVTVAAHVMDDDHQSIQLVPAGGGSSLTMQEGATSALGVRLAFRPSNGATVTLAAATKTGPDKLSVAPTQVAFYGADYSVPKFVTLAAAHLPDMIDVPASVTASTGGAPDVTLPVNILDIDTQNLLLDTDAVAVSEGMGVASAPATFNVKLSLQPPAAVMPTFTLSPSLTGKVTVDSSACASLTGAAAMTTGCAVTVTPVADNDTRNETGTITVSAPGLTPRTVAVTVTDNDVQGVVAPGSIPAIDEGTTGTFMVKLKANPVDPVTVSVISGDPAHFSVSPSTLAFTAANYATGLPVTVTSLDDNDMASYSATITVQGAAAGATSPASADVMVSETNTDIQAIAMSPGPNLSMLEGGSAQIGVRLAYRPVATEMVTLTSGDPTRLTAGGAATTMLSFSGSDYATNKFVTLTSLKDSDMANDVVHVTATDGALSADEIVTIMDVDTLNFVVSALNPGSAIPEGSSATFTVGLTVTPLNPVTVSLSSTIAAASLSATFTGGTCTLSSVSSSCTVTVAALEDANGLNESGSVTVSGGSGIASRDVPVSTIDNDTQGLVVTTPGLTSIHESPSGGTNTTSFTVKLNTQPLASTTVNVYVIPDVSDGIAISTGGTGPTPGSGLPLALTFTPTTYSMPQTVTVTGVPDVDLRTDPFSIRVTAPGLGVTDAFVNVTEIDDNTQHIVISRATSSTACDTTDQTGGTSSASLPFSPDTLAEGDTMRFCVSLQYQPLATNFVDVSTTLSGGASQLQFTTTNYGTPQMLSYMIPSDTDAKPSTGTVNLSSSGFLATCQVAYTATDPNECTSPPMSCVDINSCATCQHLSFTGLDSMGAIAIMKGGSGSVGVRLQYDPVTTTTVSCGSAGAPVSVASTGMYTFTGGATGTWSTVQNININAATDANPMTEPVTVTCTVSGATPAIGTRTFVVNATP